MKDLAPDRTGKLEADGHFELHQAISLRFSTSGPLAFEIDTDYT